MALLIWILIYPRTIKHEEEKLLKIHKDEYLNYYNRTPKIIPNLNHNLFNGVNTFEFIKPKIKKTKEIATDQILIDSPDIIGQMLTIRKTKKKTKPKFLFELIFILFIL